MRWELRVGVRRLTPTPRLALKNVGGHAVLMRLRHVGIAAVVRTLIFSQAGAASPERNQVIRMGENPQPVSSRLRVASACLRYGSHAL